MERNVILAKNAGFCFGVKRAVDEAIKYQKEFGKKIYTLGPLIHNNDVVNYLEDNDIFAIELSDADSLKKGDVVLIRSHGVKESVIKNNDVVNYLEDNDIFAIELSDADSLKKGDVVLIRSHGVKESVIKYLTDKGLIVKNATCPYVTNIQLKVKKCYEQGYKIIIVGDEKHPEVIGINGWCNDSAIITNGKAELENIPAKVCVVSQTTEKKETWNKVLNEIVRESKEIVAFNTICSATDVRQKSVQELSKEADLVFVIGGKNSSNTTKLYEICKKECPKSYHIENVKELDESLLEDESVKLVFVIGGKNSSNTTKLYEICKKECPKSYHIENVKELDESLLEDESVKTIGITAGASTPDWIINEVISKIKEL